jgi:hypothetical protein
MPLTRVPANSANIWPSGASSLTLIGAALQ